MLATGVCFASSAERGLVRLPSGSSPEIESEKEMEKEKRAARYEVALVEQL